MTPAQTKLLAKIEAVDVYTIKNMMENKPAYKLANAGKIVFVGRNENNEKMYRKV